MKYAFTYTFHRHVTEFCGTFKSLEDTMKCIKSLAGGYSDDGLGDHITEHVGYGEEDTENVYEGLDIKIYTLEEQPIDKKEVIQSWKHLDKENMTAREKRLQKEKDERDAREYKRLKEKFEG